MRLSVWRYGVTTPDVLKVLRDVPPRSPGRSGPGRGCGCRGRRIRRPGRRHARRDCRAPRCELAILVELNGLGDPNYIYVGQQLEDPRHRRRLGAEQRRRSPQQQAPAPAANRSHAVQSGDTLYAIAGKFGTTVDAIAQANSLANPDMLSIGQVPSDRLAIQSAALLFAHDVCTH